VPEDPLNKRASFGTGGRGHHFEKNGKELLALVERRMGGMAELSGT
jgi:hypothetical protein